MKVVPTLCAPAIIRPAVKISSVYCLIVLSILAGQGFAQTSLPGYTAPAPNTRLKLSIEEQARRASSIVHSPL